MIAILGALLEENDIEGRLIPPQFSIPGEFTDMEINRTGIFSAVRFSFLSLYSSSHHSLHSNLFYMLR